MNDDAELLRRHARDRAENYAAWRGAGIVATLLMALCGAAGVAAGVGWLMERNTASVLRAEIAGLQQENRALVSLHRANTVLLGELVEAAQLRRDDAAFSQLAEQAAGLHGELQKLARVPDVRAAAPRIARLVVHDISTVDRAPVPRFQARPRYPVELQRAGIGGHVVVDFTVDTEGNVQNARAARSSNPVLAQYAVEAVTRWKFAPGQKQGENVPTRLQVPIVFDLESAGQTEPEREPVSDFETGTSSGKPFRVRGRGP